MIMCACGSDRFPVAPHPNRCREEYRSHRKADPQTLLADWHKALKVNGFLMFSCLGPDTAIELREVYRQLGWPPAGHELTDMHDWGDMLVQAGFAEPVMDM